MPLPIALDYRPALLSRAGIGRATRELARSLAQHPELRVHLFGHSLARSKVATEIPTTTRLHRLPIAGRALPLLRRLGIGAEHLAQEVNRDDQAISFKKGCYLGQETVARIDAMGHVNKKLVAVRWLDDLVPSELPAAIVVDGKEVGRLTSIVNIDG